MTESTPLDQRADELRLAFDRSFAAAPTTASEATVDLLGVTVAGHAYALRLGEVAGIAQAKRVVHVASRRAELLGLTGIRGNLVAIYSLAMVLGLPRDAVVPRWLALSGRSEPIAVGLDTFPQFFRVRASDISPVERSVARHVTQVVRVEGNPRLIVDLAAVTHVLRFEIGAAVRAKE